jgi:purine catabolism regulator
MKKRAVREAEEKMRGDFYSGLLDGTIESEESMAVRAAKLGVPLHGVHCAAEMKIICREGLSRNALPVAGVERLLETARHCLRQLHDKNALLVERDGCLMALHFRRNIAGDVVDAHLREIYERVREKASTMPESPEILIGVGLPCESLMQLAQSHRQAGRALALGRKAAREQGLFFFGRMGVYSLLDAKSTDEFNENCASELNRLRSIFGENAEMYFNTLEVYFDSGDLLGASAKRMDIHVNTVKYRLNKIKDALGKAVFTDGTEKMRLYLLIKMRKIL